MRKATRVLIPLLAVCAVSTSAKGQAALSARDSVSIALMIADRVIPSLRSVDGADSTNAVCVRIESVTGAGVFVRTLDSALRAYTGGAIVAPVSISPLRAVIIDKFTGAGDSALVNWHTGGGNLLRGEMTWGHYVWWRLVRRDSIWTPLVPVRGMFGDGYIRADLPKPPNPPPCLFKPANDTR